MNHADIEAEAAAAVQSERERSLAIIKHPQAQGRVDLTMACVRSGMSVEQAALLLASAERATSGVAPDFAAIPSQVGVVREKNATEILQLQIAGVDADRAADFARMGVTAADLAGIKLPKPE